MLQLLKDFLNEVGVGEKPADRFDRNDDRLAAAALLIHVMTVDGKETADERDKLHDLLKRQFSLDDDATAELLRRVNAERKVRLSSTRIDGRFVGRLTVLNHRTDRARVEEAVAAIRRHARP